MTRYYPSVLLTPDPEGMLYDEDEVNKRVKEAVLIEREACASIAHDGFHRAEDGMWIHDRIRSRNEESK